MTVLLSAALLLVAILLAPEGVEGSAHIRYSLSELVQRSSAVVVASPTDRIARRIRSADGRRTLGIVTDVTVRVQRTLKGGHGDGDQMVVRVLGGQVGELGLRVSGAAQLPAGRSQLIFAHRQLGASWYRTIGMSQGAMAIDEVAGETWVRPTHSALQLLPPTLGDAQQLAASAPLRARPLSEMVADIQRIVGGSR